VTGALILVVAAGLFAFSIHEIQEAGYLGIGTAKAFDISGVLSDENGVGAVLRALIGYQDAPSVLEVIAWIGYVAVTGFLFFRPTQPLARPVAQPTAASRE
jgi:high-affinity iron transporter